jgi:DNA polymerase-3 subunit delta
VLSGDEEFFIDKISDFIEENILDDSEKEFNQTILYGLETDVLTIEAEAKRYPMMASYNVVIVKEAQNLKKIEDLARYAENPSLTTILVLNYKHKKIDGRKAFGKSVKAKGVYFQSKKLYDNQVAPWVENYLKARGYEIAPKATLLLVEFLGSELSKISNELDKLMVNLPKGSAINSKNIEENIGISKDFNAFELNNALGEKDILKANKIINYFGQNEKGHPLPQVLPTIYRFFSQLLLYHSVKTQNDREIAAKLGVHPFFLSQYQSASKNFPVK